MAPIAVTCQCSQIVQPAFSKFGHQRNTSQTAVKLTISHPRCIHPIEAAPQSKKHCPLRTEKLSSFKARTCFLKPESKRKVSTVALLKPFISQATTDKTIQLPINYYQVLQAGRHLLPEKIARAYEARIREVPGDGAPYSKAALAAREELLLIARNLLTNADARRSYNIAVQNDDVGLVEVPWSQLPGALALLQEVGEEEVVLEVGRAALAERVPNRVFKQDIILAMALSLVELGREAVGERPPAFAKACEHLERALDLLKEEGGKGFALELQEQIDASLARLAPYCVLDLLSKDDPPARKEGLVGVKELLTAMAEPESRWRHPDVMSRADFAEEAFSRMTAGEQVALYNERSPDMLDSIPELLAAAKAHIAEGFMRRRPSLVEDAESILIELSQKLQQNPEGNLQSDVALLRGMACMLLGRVEETKKHLGLDRSPPTGNPDIAEYVFSLSGSATDLLPGLCTLLERWLGESLLTSYQEASDVSPQISPYFEDPRVKAHLESLEKGSLLLAFGRSFRAAFRFVTRIASLPVRSVKWAGRVIENAAVGLTKPQDKKTAEKELPAEKKRLQETREVETESFASAEAFPDVQAFEFQNVETSRFDLEGDAAVERGPPFLPGEDEPLRGVLETGSLKDLDLEKFRQVVSEREELSTALDQNYASARKLSEGAVFDDVATLSTNQNGALPKKAKAKAKRASKSNQNILIASALLFCAIAVAALSMPRGKTSVSPPQTSKSVSSLPKAQQQVVAPPKIADTRMPPMDSVLAEGIIRRWQKAKAGALGRRSDVAGLRDVLGGTMLTEWTQKAKDFKTAGKRWEYDLKGISVESVRVSNRGTEAIVEVTLQERATEFDANQSPIESYEDEYRAKYDLRFLRGEGWRIVSGAVLG